MISFIKNIFKGTLHKACKKGNIEAVKQFLADGADVNAKDDDFGWTALHIAAMSTIDEQLEIAELLISRGAEVNAKDNSGRTPLHEAARHSSAKEISALLIAKGADINAKDEISGLTPLDYSENDNLHEIFRKHGAKTGEELKAEGK